MCHKSARTQWIEIARRSSAATERVERKVLAALIHHSGASTAALEEMRGGKLCPPIAKTELAAGTQFWAPEDMDVDGIPVDEVEDTLALWHSVLEDCAGEPPNSVPECSEQTRFSVPALLAAGAAGS